MGQIFNRIKNIFKAYSNDRDDKFELNAENDNYLKQIIDALNQKAEEADNYDDKAYQNNTQQNNTRQNKQDTQAAKAYKTLGISPNASIDEIKAAYKSLIKQYHPDRVQNSSKDEAMKASQKSREINDAYNYLENYRNF